MFNVFIEFRINCNISVLSVSGIKNFIKIKAVI